MHWTADQRHARVAEVLGGYTGTVIRDEWEGWKALATAPDRPTTGTIVFSGCHAHALRRFTDLQGVDQWADQMLQHYRSLYALEREAIEQHLDGTDLVDARREIRAQRSPAVWRSILALAQAIVAREAPSTAIYRAANYVVKYQTTLQAFLTDGRLPIDNNGTENVLRIVALLRKNRLFLGRTDEAGPRLAIALTVLRSCHLAHINPMTYLAKVTPELLTLRENLVAWKPGSLAHLLPYAIGLTRNHRRVGSSSIARAG